MICTPIWGRTWSCLTRATLNHSTPCTLWKIIVSSENSRVKRDPRHQANSWLARKNVQFACAKPRKHSKMKAKGIKKSYVKNHVHHQQFREVLQTKNRTLSRFRTLQSKNHTVQTVEITKSCLNAFDDKRYILEDGVTTLAYGHCEIWLNVYCVDTWTVVNILSCIIAIINHYRRPLIVNVSFDWMYTVSILGLCCKHIKLYNHMFINHYLCQSLPPLIVNVRFDWMYTVSILGLCCKHIKLYNHMFINHYRRRSSPPLIVNVRFDWMYTASILGLCCIHIKLHNHHH